MRQRRWLVLLMVVGVPLHQSISSAFELQFLRFFDERSLRLQSQDRKGRIYANVTKLTKYTAPVTRAELFTSPTSKQDRDNVWITTPYRLGVGLAAYSAYPGLVGVVRELFPGATSAGSSAALTSNFAPAISLLYGAWLSITFAILEERLSGLQRTATEESALLFALCRRCAKITDDDDLKEEALSALEEEEVLHVRKREALFGPIFEQTTIMAAKSREEELLIIANDDVYRRFQKAMTAVDLKSVARPGQLDALADVVDKLSSTRAVRLAQETNSLPAEHFAILAVFSLQLLVCFVYVAACNDTSLDGGGTSVLRVAFSVFVAFFLLVFNFALDLNDPFRGNYQIRRSAINANLIATRRLAADICGEDVARKWEGQWEAGEEEQQQSHH